MAEVMKVRIVVLWEEEIREAARRLALMLESAEKTERTPEEDEIYGVRITDAMSACLAAIGESTDNGASLVLCAKRSVIQQCES